MEEVDIENAFSGKHNFHRKDGHAVFRGQPDARFWTRSKFARRYIDLSGEVTIDEFQLDSEAKLREFIKSTESVPESYFNQRSQELSEFSKHHSELNLSDANYATVATLAQHYGWAKDFLDITWALRLQRFLHS